MGVSENGDIPQIASTCYVYIFFMRKIDDKPWFDLGEIISMAYDGLCLTEFLYHPQNHHKWALSLNARFIIGFTTFIYINMYCFFH